MGVCASKLSDQSFYDLRGKYKCPSCEDPGRSAFAKDIKRRVRRLENLRNKAPGVIFRDGFALGLKVREAQNFLEAFSTADGRRPDAFRAPASRDHSVSEDLGQDEAVLPPPDQARVPVKVEDEVPKVCGQDAVEHFSFHAGSGNVSK